MKRPGLFLAAWMLLPFARADEVVLTLENHLFSPSELLVPAGKRVRLIIINKDSTAEEIDSFDLNREKVVFGNSRAVIHIGPLAPGDYELFGEFHPQTAVALIRAVPMQETHHVN